MQQVNWLLDNIRVAIRGIGDIQTLALSCKILKEIQISRLRQSGRPLALRVVEQCIQNGDIFTLQDVCKSLSGRAEPLYVAGVYHGQDRIITGDTTKESWNMWSADILGKCLEMIIPDTQIYLPSDGMKIVGCDLYNEYIAYKRDDEKSKIYISTTNGMSSNIQSDYFYEIKFSGSIYDENTPCDISFDKKSSELKIEIGLNKSTEEVTGIPDHESIPKHVQADKIKITSSNTMHIRPSQRSLNYCSIFRKIEYVSIVSDSVGICKYLRSSKLYTTYTHAETRGEVGLFDIDMSRSYEYTHHPDLNFTVGNQVVVEEGSGGKATKYTVGVALYFRSHDGGTVQNVYPGVYVNEKYYDPFAKITSLNIKKLFPSDGRIVRGSIGFRKIIQRQNEYNIYFILAAIDDKRRCGLYFGYIGVDSKTDKTQVDFHMSTNCVYLNFSDVTAIACSPDGLWLAISDIQQTHIINISGIGGSFAKYTGGRNDHTEEFSKMVNAYVNNSNIVKLDHRTILSSYSEYISHLNIYSKAWELNVTAATNMGSIIARTHSTTTIDDHLSHEGRGLTGIFTAIAQIYISHENYNFPKGQLLKIIDDKKLHIYNPKSEKYTYTCMAAYPYDNSIFVGTESGDILMFDNKLILQRTIKLHSLQICGLSYMNNQLLSADIGGKFKWTTTV
jgi:hypothetical protein